jgi:preprotein translocase subunit SecB
MDAEILYPIQLLDVRLFEATLERIVSEAADAGSGAGSDAEPDRDATPLLTVKVDTVRSEEDRDLSVFLTIEVQGPDVGEPAFHLLVTLEGLFEAQIDLNEIDEATWEEFEATSSITLLWPYAREVVHSFSRRMRVDLPVLPTLNRLAMQPPADVED